METKSLNVDILLSDPGTDLAHNISNICFAMASAPLNITWESDELVKAMVAMDMGMAAEGLQKFFAGLGCCWCCYCRF
jgi:hypothetical protein